MDTQTQQLLDKVAVLLKKAGAQDVFIFGSATKDTFTKTSDIDLAVSGLPAQVFFRVLGQIEDILKRPVDLIDLDEQTPFTKYLREEGELQRVG